MKKALLIYISIFCSFFIFSQKKEKIETMEMNLTYNNTTYIGTYIGNIEKVKKNKFPEGSGNFKGLKEGSEPKVELSYSGGWKEGSFSGNGTLVIADTTFTGNFTDSKLTGIGKAWWKSNGFYYEGEFQNNRGNGTGKINTNSYEYNGSVTNFLANGTGKITYKSKISEDGNIGKILSPPTYTGEFKDGNMFGKGTLIYANGDTLTGIWNGLKFTGNGKLTLASGSIYNGDWVNGETYGFGVLTYSNGDSLVGNFIGLKFTGKGKYTWPNGSIYQGDWKDGVRNGKGKLIWADGGIYVGDWKDDLRNGKGKFTWADGGIYEGDWKDDKRNGKGKYTWVNGDVYEGDWKGSEYINGVKKNIDGTYESGIWNEKREFSGKAKRISGNKSIWEGEWVGLIPIKNGKVNFENGNFYEGEWDGKLENNYYSWNLNGQGIMKYQNGDVYNGSWLLGIKSGQGEMSYKNGTSYRGEWANDLPNGQGEFLQTDGKVLSGKFINGIFQKPFLCKEVKIGNQIWMAENLTVAKFRNGDLIPQAKSIQEWQTASDRKQPVWCYYEFNDANGLKYGKLYNWYAVNDTRGLAPIGWRIPSPSDFKEMKCFSPDNRSYLKDAENPYFISSNNDMLNKIISDIKSKTGWDKNGTNASGFNALPSGYLDYSHVLRKGSFNSIGESTYFWTSICCTDFDSSASALQLNKYTSDIGSNKPKENCYSVRCIKE
jgi:uncharacterized protein (TIGR02145 family)